MTNLDILLEEYNKTMHDFLDNSKAVKSLPKNLITIFGSAKLPDSNQYSLKTLQLASELSKIGYGIVAGGGPSIMKAGAKGAYLNDKSVGVTINLQGEVANEFLNYIISCKTFPVRKLLLSLFSQFVIVMPGGYGTLDELFTLLNVIKTEKHRKIPIILFGKKFWNGLIDWLIKSPVKTGTLTKKDLNLFIVLDSVKEVKQYILENDKSN